MNGANDPVANYYMLGYSDMNEGRKARRVPRHLMLAYLHGRSDARSGKPAYYLKTAARTLLASDDYSEEELAALSIMGMNKPSYRAVEFERVGLGPYTKESPVLKSLVAKGLVKFTATGIQLDKPLAVAVMKRHPAPEKYKRELSNYSMQFKRKEPAVQDSEDFNQQLSEQPGPDSDHWKSATPAAEAQGSADFIELLRSKLNVGDRKVVFDNYNQYNKTYSTVFIHYINLPENLAGGDAESENNRLMLQVSGFGKEEHAPPPSGKVKVELSISAVQDAAKGRLRMRAKSGTPEQIAKYVADFLNMVAKTIEPRYTHTKV